MGIENNYVDNRDERNALNTLKLVYNQMLGGLGGGHVQSIHIGNINIGRDEGQTLLLRNPNVDQRATFRENPELFPNELWDNKNITLT